MAAPTDITGTLHAEKAPAAFGDFWQTREEPTRTAMATLLRLVDTWDADRACAAVFALSTGWRFIRNASFDEVPATVTPLSSVVRGGRTHVTLGVEVLRNPLSWVFGADFVVGSTAPLATFARRYATPYWLLRACACAAGVLVAPKAFTVASAAVLNGGFIGIGTEDGDFFVSSSSSGWLPTVGATYAADDIVAPDFEGYYPLHSGHKWWEDAGVSADIVNAVAKTSAGDMGVGPSTWLLGSENLYLSCGAYGAVADRRGDVVARVLDVDRAARIAAFRPSAAVGVVESDTMGLLDSAGFSVIALRLPSAETVEGRRARAFANENKIVGTVTILL